MRRSDSIHLNVLDVFLIGVFLTSLLATAGSLFFSEVMRLPPCQLCWLQRICMYPLVAISFVGMLRKSEEAVFFAMPLVLTGLGVAGYHNLLYYGFIENIVPCSQGVSCTSRQIEWLGFITIPFLSLVAFAILTGLILFTLRNLLQTSSKSTVKKMAV